MLPLAVQWAVRMIIFVVAGAVFGIAAGELGRRKPPTSDLEGLGAWGPPMLAYLGVCLLAGIAWAILKGLPASVPGTLLTFVPGAILGSFALFVAMLLWVNWRDRVQGQTS